MSKNISKMLEWASRPENKVKLFYAGFLIGNLMLVLGVAIFIYLMYTGGMPSLG